MAISFVGAGTFTGGTFATAITPPLPSGVQAGDLLCCFSYQRTTAGTNSVSAGWSTLDTVDTLAHYHKLFYRIATGSDTAPTITPAGTTSGQTHVAVVVAYRGVSGLTPFGTPGTAYTTGTGAEDIGPIQPATATTTGGAVIVFGARATTSGIAGGTTALLTGDGLTWVQAAHGEAALGNYVSPAVVQHAIWTGAPPTLTAKTLDITGGSVGTVLGRMYLLIPTAASDITYIARGEDRTGGPTWNMDPTIPPGVQSGDFLFLTAYMINPGTMTLSGGGGGWVEHSSASSTGQLLKSWYRWADGTETAPLITNSGTDTPLTLSDSWIVAFRGVDTTQPFGTHGANSFNASATNVGPIAAPASLPTKGAVVLYGARQSAQWTSVANVTGDGLTWVEVFDQFGITSAPYALSACMSYALWTSSTPTITAKTLVPTGGAAGPGTGKMFVLRGAGEPGVAERTITATADVVVSAGRQVTASADVVVAQPGGGAVWPGVFVAGTHVGTLEPSLPADLVNGDLLFVLGYLRNAGTLSISAGWTEHSLVDTTQNGSNFYLQTWYTFFDGTQTAPSISINGGATSPQTLTLAVVLAARGVNATTPFGEDGPDSFNASAANVGPAAVPATLPSSGVAVVCGIRNGLPWTNVDTLIGDGLTWVEVFDNVMQTASGLGTAMVVDYASWQTTAPALTAKTFTVNGLTGPGMSKIFVLSYIDTTGAQQSVSAQADIAVATAEFVASQADVAVTVDLAITATADVYVQSEALANSIVAAADVYVEVIVQPTVSIGATADVYVVTPEQRNVTALADVYVSDTPGTRSVIAFADCVVADPVTSPDAPRTALAELSAENVDTAWLVLLEIDHPDLDGETIRVTSDGVPTIHNGLVYSSFPFSVILPDDVEGRPPQAQLQIDNTTQEIIAVLRGLVTPPTLSIIIVRSITPDVVEYGWYGLEWTASNYDKSAITGTLTMPDLTVEEFPFETFSGQWRGLFS